MKLMPKGTVVNYWAAKVQPDQSYELAAFISTTPEVTASKPSKAGTSSAAAKAWIVSRPPDMAATLAMNASGLPGPTV